MARPYSNPTDRAREGQNSQPSGETNVDHPIDPAPEKTDSPKAFLPAGFTGEKQCKPGDAISVRVTAVDPETGEYEIEFAGKSHDDGKMPFEKSMDQALPEGE